VLLPLDQELSSALHATHVAGGVGVITKQLTGKIYFYVYPSAFQNLGGGEVQLTKTKEALETLGADIHLFNQWEDRFGPGDLVHVFGSVKDALGLMVSAKAQGAKIVLSPIIWYNWQSSLMIDYPLKERLLCLSRQFAKVLFPALPSQRRRMMLLADLILAGSQMEAQQISRFFSIPKERIRVVTYGVEDHFRDTSKDLFIQEYGLENFVLSVGRIEPRKNQLSLIRAMKSVKRALVLIGDPVSHHADYFNKCKREAGDQVHFLGSLPHNSELLCSAYAACDVFALPTWFETPGHAAMEAALAGSKVAVTREGSTREYFQNFAEYVNPGSVSDVSVKLNKLLAAPKTTELASHVRENYTWANTASKTMDAYRSIASAT
jgi:glycosyltransferase involved in cell wall biosynthesis